MKTEGYGRTGADTDAQTHGPTRADTDGCGRGAREAQPGERAPIGSAGRGDMCFLGRGASGEACPAEGAPQRMDADSPRGLYVHVCFCSSFCSYCDFASEIRTIGRARKYLEGIEKELLMVCREPIRPRTVYIGGGTPSAMEADEIEALFRIIGRKATMENVEEMTFEGNPESLSPEKLRLFESLGATRVSMGVQSFDARALKTLGRRHGEEEVRRAFREVRAAGIGSVGLDLIYGIPGQSLEDFRRDLEKAIDLGPDHVSAYGLSLEEGTPLAGAIADGVLAAAPDELYAEMYALACELLEQAGIMQYEISNFARPGCESEHNRSYWRRESYLGLGPSAASFVGGERRRNAGDLDEYCRMLDEGRSPAVERERLEGEAAAREELVLRLRMTEGVDMAEMKRRTGLDVEGLHGGRIALWRELGLVEVDGKRLRLTRKGFSVANSILSELV